MSSEATRNAPRILASLTDVDGAGVAARFAATIALIAEGKDWAMTGEIRTIAIAVHDDAMWGVVDRARALVIKRRSAAHDPIDFDDAQSQISESLHGTGDSPTEHITESLCAAVSCETTTDLLANLREASDTARMLADSCDDLIAGLEAHAATGGAS